MELHSEMSSDNHLVNLRPSLKMLVAGHAESLDVVDETRYLRKAFATRAEHTLLQPLISILAGNLIAEQQKSSLKEANVKGAHVGKSL